jgi:hypothetical protein
VAAAGALASVAAVTAMVQMAADSDIPPIAGAMRRINDHNTVVNIIGPLLE